MDIFLRNTLGGEKEKFAPIKPGVVSMYNCGPTVYNYAHLGNLRSYIFADVLRRMFEYNGYEVKQIINITDIGHLSSDSDEGEDKMTKALKREDKPLTLEAMREVADFYFDKFKEDLSDLNVESPHKFPFASEHIEEDIELIKKLSDGGFVYKTSDGMYFDTDKFVDYGKLGNVGQSDNKKSRVEQNPEKKNPRDFAVWKFNDKLGYDSPFGKGFPGWHIECTAMSIKYLGQEFDVHTGGIDHIPVHHNNEIAQAVCAGYKYARVWMHNEFLTIGSEKMAKSDNNFLTLQSLKDRNIDPLAYRYLLLTARYSSPIQFSWEALEGAQTAWKKLKESLKSETISGLRNENDIESKIENYKKTLNEYINDDLDTPKALALVWELVKDTSVPVSEKRALVLDFDRVFGLKLDADEDYDIPENVKKLVEERDKARAEKNFGKSDELRKNIELFGFEVKDTPGGTELSPKK